MNAYKGFNNDMTCRGFQFEEGKTYEEPEADLCHNGFHACEMPLDVFNYYAPATSEYHEVELGDVTDQTGNDSKRCGKKIKIGAKLSIRNLVDAQIEYISERTHFVKGGRATGDQGAASATGCQGAASATGCRGAASATGTCGAASATGDQGAASATGTCGAASATGTCGAASATGYRGAASATGDQGAASATGDQGAASATGCQGAASATGTCGAASATGYRGAASATGEDSVAMACGYCGRAKASLGSVIFLVERGEWNGKTYHIMAANAAIVDGKNIKADTWYTLKNGAFVEANER